MAVGFRQRKVYNKNPSRRTQLAVPGARNNVQAPTPIGVSSTAAPVGDVVTIAFDQPVILDGLPGFTIPGGHVVAASLNDAQHLAVTFSASPDGAVMTIPFQDPSVRNKNAGYMNAGTITLQGG